MPYLSQDRILEIVSAFTAAEMVKEGTLNALLENIDSAYTVNLPEGPDPLPRLMQTLGRLNRTERLVDGTMPFQIWLKNAVPFAAARPEALKVINRALDEVSKGFKPASGGASASPDPGPKVFYQPVGAHECDMGLLIKAAVREIMRRPQGLIGFAVRTSSPVYLRNLLKRLRSNLPMQLHERELQAVTSMDSSMRHVEMLARSWAEMLKTSDVLVQIQVFSAEVAMKLWKWLCDRFPAPLPKRLIVLVAFDSGAACPQDTVELKPEVDDEDLRIWLSQILERLDVSKGDAAVVTDRWITALRVDYGLEDGYYEVGLIYEHLEGIEKGLQADPQRSTLEALIPARSQQDVQAQG